MPFDSIPVIHRELVVEIVIALSNSDESSDHMIPGCVLVVERSLTKPMGERVDTESRLSGTGESDRCCEYERKHT
jgi:hypothetical protein